MTATSPRLRRRRVGWADLDPIGVGAELRAARELLGLPIEEVAEDTRIRPGHLVALEEEHFSQLPTGVAGRGLLRTYATYLGLDAVELLSALETHGRLSLGAAFDESEGRRAAPTHSLAPRLAGLIIAVVSVLGLAFYLYSQYSVFVAAEAAGAQRASVSARGGPQLTPVPPTPTTPIQSTVGQASFAASAAAPSPSSVPPSPTATHASAAPTAATTPMPSPTPIPPRPTPVELVVEATVSTETRARVEVDGKLLSDDLIAAGDQRTWRGTKVTVQVDDGGAVEIFLNGRPAGTLGSPGQPASMTWAR